MSARVLCIARWDSNDCVPRASARTAFRIHSVTLLNFCQSSRIKSAMRTLTESIDCTLCVFRSSSTNHAMQSFNRGENDTLIRVIVWTMRNTRCWIRCVVDIYRKLVLVYLCLLQYILQIDVDYERDSLFPEFPLYCWSSIACCLHSSRSYLIFHSIYDVSL